MASQFSRSLGGVPEEGNWFSDELLDDVIGVVVAVGAGKDEDAEFHRLRISAGVFGYNCGQGSRMSRIVRSKASNGGRGTSNGRNLKGRS